MNEERTRMGFFSIFFLSWEQSGRETSGESLEFYTFFYILQFPFRKGETGNVRGSLLNVSLLSDDLLKWIHNGEYSLVWNIMRLKG